MSGANGLAGRIRRLALKELRETLRDRRTIITLVLMPVLVYPLLSLVFQKFLVKSLKPASEAAYHIGFSSNSDLAEFEVALSKGNALLERRGESRAQLPKAIHYDDLEGAVANLDVDLGMRVRTRDEAVRRRGPPDFELLFLRSSQTGREAATFVERRLNAAALDHLAQRLQQKGERDAPSGVVVLKPVEPKDGGAAFSLATLVPLILILMTITGAVYPAIDLTAGERERGTLEALIAAPVPRLGLLFAKYVAVLTVAMLTATINLVSMSTTIWAAGLSPVLFGPEGLSLRLIAEVFGLLILFAAFFSALLLAVTSFARSFKEAQAYLIPLMLLSLTPGIVSLLPDVTLDGGLAVTPLINVVLLARDLFEQHRVDPVLATAVVVSTGLFAAAALGIAARVFGADAILYGSHGSWPDLVRRPAEPSSAPTAASALLCLALLFPAHFVTSALAGRIDVSPESRLVVAALLTVILFAGLPILAASLRRVRLPDGIGLSRFPGLALVGAILLGVSLWPLVFEMVAVLEDLGVTSIDEALRKLAEQVAESWKTVPPWLLVVTMGVVPAVCEELFFRGFLLRALRTRLNAWPAILASAALFGAFHLVMTGGLATVRFVPSTLLGIVLGWICVRTGSAIPGMILHAVHNSLIALVTHYKDQIASSGWVVEEASHLPRTWLVAAVVVAALGAAVISFSTRHRAE